MTFRLWRIKTLKSGDCREQAERHGACGCYPFDSVHHAKVVGKRLVLKTQLPHTPSALTDCHPFTALGLNFHLLGEAALRPNPLLSIRLC